MLVFIIDRIVALAADDTDLNGFARIAMQYKLIVFAHTIEPYLFGFMVQESTFIELRSLLARFIYLIHFHDHRTIVVARDIEQFPFIASNYAYCSGQEMIIVLHLLQQ